MVELLFGNRENIRIIAGCNKWELNGLSKDELLNLGFQATNKKVIKPKRLKPSCFNYVERGTRDYVIFNTLYNSLVKLSPREFAAYTNLDQSSDKLLDEWFDLGLIVDANLDEKKALMRYGDISVNTFPKETDAIVCTTMNCNARCAYCFESSACKPTATSVNPKDIVDFLIPYVTEQGLKITWFGGEPLLNTGFIDNAVTYLKAQNVKFYSFLITNGSLLSREMMENKFPEWQIMGMQITVDGTEKEYERIKNYKYSPEGKYKLVLQNIKTAAELNIKVDIRLNIDTANVKNIFELLGEIEREFGACPSVTVYPAFISGTEYMVPEEDRAEIILKMIKILRNPQKITFSSGFTSEPRFRPCDIANDTSFSFDTEGNVYACERHIGVIKHAMGTINSFKHENDSRSGPYSLRRECEDCVFLPKCMGGCETSYNIGDIPCMIEKYMIQAYLKWLAE